MFSEVDVLHFSAAHADGAFVLDVREPHEYVSGHVPGAVLVPVSQIDGAVHELPSDQPIYVICQSGNRSRAAARHLAALGRHAVSVIGGTSGWVGAGRPVVRGARANLA